MLFREMKGFRHKGQHTFPIFSVYLSILLLFSAVPLSSALADGIIYGSKRLVRKDVTLPQGYTSVHVQGPIELKLFLDDDDFNDCGSLGVYTDENIHPYISVTIDGNTLNIKTTEKIIPSNWIDMSLRCSSVISLVAGEFSKVGVASVRRDTFSAIADGSYISLIGKLKSLKASAINNGLFSLGMLELVSAELTASNESYIYLGSGQIKSPAIEDLKLEALDNSEIHLRFKDVKILYREQIAPGVFLRSKRLDDGFDARRRFYASDYKKTKEKMENYYRLQ